MFLFYLMPRQESFQLFGSVHLLTLGLIFFTAACFVLIARQRRLQRWVKPMSRTLAVVLLGNEFIFITYVIRQGLWSLKWGLPLQLCDLAIFAVAYSLIRHQQFVWELAYFWGLGGTLQAVLTPELSITFPSYFYIKFFLTHGCILIGVITLSAGLGRPIDLNSVKRVWLITNMYALMIGIFNKIFNANYLYLCEKPSQASIMDYLGSWPFYILSLEGVLIISLFLYYLPYYCVNKFKKV